MWYAFTMDYGVAACKTKREVVSAIQTGFTSRIKKMDKGSYLYQHKEDDGFWYDKYYIFGSKSLAIKNGFCDQLKEFEEEKYV